MREINLKIFTSGETHMITEVQRKLIYLLKDLGINREATIDILTLAATDENREKLGRAIVARYDETGVVTEEEILKLLLMIVGKRKQKDTNSTTTEE